MAIPHLTDEEIRTWTREHMARVDLADVVALDRQHLDSEITVSHGAPQLRMASVVSLVLVQ